VIKHCRMQPALKSDTGEFIFHPHYSAQRSFDSIDFEGDVFTFIDESPAPLDLAAILRKIEKIDANFARAHTPFDEDVKLATICGPWNLELAHELFIADIGKGFLV
jgi:hypothetical protein